MMTRERALEIKQQCQLLAEGSPWSDQMDHILTPQEKQEIITYWKNLPGGSSFLDAFFDICNGTVGELG